MAACVLHNICLDNGDNLDTEKEDFNQPSHTGCSRRDLNVHLETTRQEEVYNKLFNNN